MYEVYHWDETKMYDGESEETGLFTGFINTLLRIKQESSGWPDHVTTEDDKRRYVSQYKDHEGIELDADHIEKNPGRRSIAKLLLNSFWGKYSERPVFKDNMYVRTETRLMQVLLDETKKVTDFHIINENLACVTFEPVEEFVEAPAYSNIFIAIFTTSWARLRLYNVLSRLNERVLYFDTDSVIYIEDEADPIPTGVYLGDLTNELAPGEDIIEFASSGPKNYAYKTSRDSIVCKVKGFTLNYQNSKVLNFDTLRDIVLKDADSVKLPPQTKIDRNKLKYQVINKEESKTFKLVYDKRRRIGRTETLPFGY